MISDICSKHILRSSENSLETFDTRNVDDTFLPLFMYII